MSDERVAGIPIADIDAPFADLRRCPELVPGSRLADPLGAHTRVRAGVAARLPEGPGPLPDGPRPRVVEGDRRHDTVPVQGEGDDA